MKISHKLYPYPVLTYYSDDYQQGKFETKITISKNGYNIRIDFTTVLTNEGLKELIQEGKAMYVYHLECAQTCFRKAVITNKDLESETFSENSVCGKLQICPFIVATQNLIGYSNAGFHKDYSNTTFDIEKGCILALGRPKYAIISKEIEDLANIPSIFSIIRNADAKIHQMIVDIYNQKIIIKLPLNEYYRYRNLNKAFEVQPVLNSLTIIPALTYALEELKIRSIEERAEFADYGWYRTVRKVLHAKFNCEIESEDFEQQDMLILAQQLINDPIPEAFTMLANEFSSTGGEDE
jgi:hypothetical protein